MKNEINPLTTFRFKDHPFRYIIVAILWNIGDALQKWSEK
jgi:hypothetical protein